MLQQPCHVKIAVLSIVAAASFSLMGCSSSPLRTYEPLGDYNFGTIAIMPGAELAPEELERPPAGAGEGARAGAKAHTASAMRQVLARCGGIGLAGLIVGAGAGASVAGAGVCALIVGPVVAIIAAPTGAVIGAATAESKEPVLEAHNAIVKYLAEFKPSELVAALAFKMAQAQTAYSVQHAAHSSDPKLLASSGVDTVLELTVTELRFVSVRDGAAFFVKASTRLIRTKDAKTLEEYVTGYGSETRRYSDWVANGAQLLREALSRAWEEIAESAMAEHLLVYHTGAHTLHAELPGQRKSGLSVLASDYDIRPDGYAFVPAGARRPLLRWEPLDSLLARTSAAPKSAPRNVSYELRVYRATDGREKWPGRLVYTRNGIPLPEHVIEEDLEPCGYYYWTVRAHFMVDHRSRTTKFSSLWQSESDFEGELSNKNIPFRTRSAYYYRFRTGASNACPGS